MIEYPIPVHLIAVLANSELIFTQLQLEKVLRTVAAGKSHAQKEMQIHRKEAQDAN